MNYERDELFDEMGMRRLKDSYMTENETSPQERLWFVSKAFGSNEEHSKRLYEYASKHWLSYSTPILSYGRTKKGLPISCYLSWLEDTAEELVNTLAEVNWLSMLGGGVGIGFGIRSEDEKSVGVMPHMKVYEKSSLAYFQGNTRRGSYAAYLDIDHPNIIQFIEMRKPTGDHNMRCLEIHHGVNISDKFMKIIENCMRDENFDDTWELKDPGSDIVKHKVSAKWLWEQILDIRMRTGEPYIHFIDTSNREMPQFLKDKNLNIRQSNICTEILLPTNAERTAVCCLSSLNLSYWDEWKDNEQFYYDVCEMLDNALNVFIEKAPEQVKRAVYSASQERSIGIGALGFHELLQKKNIPFESAMATSINIQIFDRYKKYIDKANFKLGEIRGEAPDTKGTGRRFSHTIAIAPNASTSLIMGNTSPSIEPYRANAYRQDTMSGSFLVKNKTLDKIIKERCKNYDETWNDIVTSKGSVQHVDWLSDYEKEVFKTATEINQHWIIEHASIRQKYIDQGQSLNLFFDPRIDVTRLHDVHFNAWKKGIKTLYYCRSNKIYHGDSMNKQIERIKIDEETCLSCEG